MTWVAHASRVLASAPSRSRTFPKAWHGTRRRAQERLLRRDTATSTRDACATQSGGGSLNLPLDFLSWPALGSRAMQNQNLMSSFEFIAALMSIIIGLGVTNLLAGAGRAFYRRKENPIDEVHIVLTIATLLLLVLQWWVTFRWNTEVTWTFDKFLVLIAWAVVLYLLTVLLYPPDLSEAEEHQGRFDRNRAGYYSAFVATCLLDIAATVAALGLLQPLRPENLLPHAIHLPILGEYRPRAAPDRRSFLLARHRT